AALGAAGCQNQTAAFGGHAGAEAVTAGADEFGRLVRALHGDTPSIRFTKGRLAFTFCPARRPLSYYGESLPRGSARKPEDSPYRGREACPIGGQPVQVNGWRGA